MTVTTSEYQTTISDLRPNTKYDFTVSATARHGYPGEPRKVSTLTGEDGELILAMIVFGECHLIFCEGLFFIEADYCFGHNLKTYMYIIFLKVGNRTIIYFTIKATKRFQIIIRNLYYAIAATQVAIKTMS